MRGLRAATLAGAASTVVLLVGCGTKGPALPAASVTAAPTTAVAAESATTTTPPAAFTGLWPVKDLAAATRLQRDVDSGRQPWLLEPESVAAAYASSQLDMKASVLVQAYGGTVVLREPSTGRVVTITEVQPVKKGPGGIWVVTASR